MRYLSSIILVLSLIGGCNIFREQSGCQQWPGSNSADPFKILQKSRCFRVGGVGFAGVTPPEEIALRKLMDQEDSSDVLQELFNKGTPAGKLYALLGLRFIDSAKFEELAPQLKNVNDKIDTQAGCIVFTKTVEEIFKSIDDGNLDFYIQREI